MTKLDLAKSLALSFHKDQMYGSNPYIYHIEGVVQIASQHPWADDLGLDNVKIVAYCHDLVEDTSCSIETIDNLFGEDIAKAVKLLTKTDGYDHKEYVDNIKKNRLALVVKKSDALFNFKESVLQMNTKRIIRYSKLIQELCEQ